MLITEALNAILIANGPVRELLEIADTSPATYRIFPGVIPHDIDVNDPTLAYRAIDDGVPTTILDAAQHAESTPSHSIYALFSTARDYDSAHELDDALRQALHGYQGWVESVDGDSELYVQGIFVRGARDFYDDRTETHQAIRLIDVWYSQEMAMRQDSFTPVVRNGDTGAVITNTPGVEGFYQYRPGESVKIWIGGFITLGVGMNHIIFELPSGLWTPRTADGPPASSASDIGYAGHAQYTHPVDGADTGFCYVNVKSNPLRLKLYRREYTTANFSAGAGVEVEADIEFPIL